MPGHPVPQRTDITGQGAPVPCTRAARLSAVLGAALLALALATAPSPARAASVLSDGSVTPTSGTTATVFSFTVHYTSTDSPTRPAQAVWAEVGGTTVTLVKVSGSAHNGTWEGTATLPAGTWQVTFHASTSTDPQPDPLLGPIVTVSEPPPPPTPSPTPQPTATPEPPLPTPEPTLTLEPIPSESSSPADPPLPPRPVPQPTPRPTGGDDPTSAPPSPSPTPSPSGSARPGTPAPTPTRTADPDGDPVETPGPSDAAAEEADTPPGSMLATLLIVGGTMSLAGAAVLARQLFVARGARPR